MKSIIICLVAFLAVSNGLHMYEKYPGLMNFGPKRSIMAVMMQVETVMRTGGPLDAITRTLNEYETAIRQEQIAHDALFEKNVKECKEEKKFRKGEIEEASQAMEEAKTTLSGCKTQKLRNSDDMNVCKRQIKEKTNEIITVHTTANREKYEYDTKQGIYGRQKKAIEEAIDMVATIAEGDGSFIQVARHSNKMLLNAVQLGHTHHMVPILAVMANLATQTAVEGAKADAELVSKLQSMLTTFKEKLEAKNIEEIKLEQKRVKAYNSNVKRIKSILANLGKRKSALEKELIHLKKCIDVQTNILNKGTAKYNRNAQLLNDAKKMCTANLNQYKAAKKGRFNELEMLAAIKVKVHHYFKKLSKGVSAGGKSGKHKKYKNKSKYNKKKFKAKK